MESKEYEFKGGSMNGFIMLFLVLAMVFGMFYFIGMDGICFLLSFF